MRIAMMTAAALALVACSGGPDEAIDEPVAGDAVDENGADAGEAEEALASMPENFRGSWDFSQADCGTGTSEMKLEVGADSVAFYESSGEIEEVVRTAPNVLRVRHSFAGEGEQWEEVLGYELSEDGERLTVTTPDGSMSIRMRCA